MKITVASMVRNEAGKFWRSALKAWSTFADQIVVLDDGSTDETVDIATSYSAIVFHSEGADRAWGSESPRRKQLFEAAESVSDDGDIIFILDADMIPARDPRLLFEGSEADAYAFRLYDLWQENADGIFYREDKFWRGHQHPRIWAVRKQQPPKGGWKWNERGIHCGHLPLNLNAGIVGAAPDRFSLLHYAYISEDLRLRKHNLYRTVKNQLSGQEHMHALSIVDPSPALYRLPFTPELRLECASS